MNVEQQLFFCYVEHCRLQEDVAAAAPSPLSLSSFPNFIFAPRKIQLRKIRRETTATRQWQQTWSCFSAGSTKIPGILRVRGKKKTSFFFFYFLLFKCWKTEMGLGRRPRWLWLSEAEGRRSCWWSIHTVSAEAASDWSVLHWNLPGSRENVRFCSRHSSVSKEEKEREKKDEADVETTGVNTHTKVSVCVCVTPHAASHQGIKKNKTVKVK